MTDRFTSAEMAEIMSGASNSRSQFIALHRSMKDQPDAWFYQQERELAAFRQAEFDYGRAASRDERKQA